MPKKSKGERFENVCQKTLASGAVSWTSKGDLQLQDHLVECKFTDLKGFRITTKILGKLWEQATNANKQPLLEIGIRDTKAGSIWMLSCLLTKERMR